MQQLELPVSRPVQDARVRLLNTALPRDHRLARNLQQLVASDPHVANLGPDADFLAKLREYSLNERDLATAAIVMGDASFILVCVRQARWHDPGFMERLQALRSEERDIGKRVVLIPEAFVQRQPRFQHTKPVARAAGYRVTPKSRMMILAALVERGPTSLKNCATLVENTHPDPVGCILHLVSTGAVWMDLDRRLGLDGLVHLPVHEPDALQLNYGVAA